jgi:2-polyprenyl-6-methoxyphenol hydroxylase-like FAD-dependent oxidoreductase
MTDWDYDVIVAGAGVAGTSSAILLGQEGYRVLLLDRATFPRHKTCGEGIMPEGVSILESLGLLPAILEQGAGHARGVRFRSRSGVWAQADFPAPPGSPAVSLVIRRYELDHLLLERARQTPTVTVREGFVVTGAIYGADTVVGVTGYAAGKSDQFEKYRAPLTVGADGMHSCFHGRYGIERHLRARQRWGVAGHLSGVEDLDPYIEVLFQDQSEIYMAPLTDGLALVAILAEKPVMRIFRGNLAHGYHDFLKAAPGLGPRIRKSKLVPPVGALGPLGFSVRPVYTSGLLLVGDSAGFLDPITGEGMTLALKCALAIVPIVRQAFARRDWGRDVLAPYAAARARAVDDVARLTRLMLDVTRFPWLADRAIRRLSADPALFQKLLGIAAGTRRYADITAQDRLALALG